jgi:hypothetical protein
MEVNTELTDTDQTWSDKITRYSSSSSHGLGPLACYESYRELAETLGQVMRYS